MAGDTLFMPSTIWVSDALAGDKPSFLEATGSKVWLGGSTDVENLLLLVEGPLVALYIAGYDVHEILIGNDEDDWVIFDTASFRVIEGQGQWSDYVGESHPGVLAVAIHAAPMPYRRSSNGVVPIAIPLTNPPLTAERGGWVHINAPTLKIQLESADAITESILNQLEPALAEYDAAESMAAAPGFVGMYDTENWRSNAAATFVDEDTVTALKAIVTGIITSKFEDRFPDRRAFLGDEVPLDRVPGVITRDPDCPKPSKRVARRIALAAHRAGDQAIYTSEQERDLVKRQLPGLADLGIDPCMQSLTMGMLRAHAEGVVDLVHNYAIRVETDPCANAHTYVLDSHTAELTAGNIEEICDCIGLGLDTLTPDLVNRLVVEYPRFYDDPLLRGRMRDTLLNLCVVAESQNASLSDSGVASLTYELSAEFFAERLAAMMATDPDDTVETIDWSNYPNPIAEYHDLWVDWIALLPPLGDHTNATPGAYKLHTLLPTVFNDCGNGDIALQVADRVLEWYGEELATFGHAHHWSSNEHGTTFSDALGSTEPKLYGWSQSLLVRTLQMLTKNRSWQGTDAGAALLALVEQVVEPDPLIRLDIAEFEERYTQAIDESSDDDVHEYMVLLGLISDYGRAPDEATAARYKASYIRPRLEAADMQDAAGVVEGLRDNALALMRSPEYRTTDEYVERIKKKTSSASFVEYVKMLDAEDRQAFEDTFIGHVNTVCPVVGPEVIGAMRALDSAADSGLLIHQLTETELKDLIATVLSEMGLHSQGDFDHLKFARQMAKVEKQGFGIAKTWLSAVDTGAIAGVASKLEFQRAATAELRSAIWTLTDTGADSVTLPLYLDQLRQNQGLVDDLNNELKLMAEAHPNKVNALDGIGQVATVVTAGIVLYQFAYGEGVPTSTPAALSAWRDVAVGAGAAAYLGTQFIGWFVQRPDDFVDVLKVLKTGNSFLGAFSGWVSFGTQAYTGFERYVAGDWIGVFLYTSSATLSGISLLAATGLIAASPVTALAGFLAAALVMVDVAISYMKHVERIERFRRAAVDPECFFAELVEVRTHDAGLFTRTHSYTEGDVVGPIGTLSGVIAGSGIDPTPEFTQEAGISRIDALSQLSQPTQSLSCPLPATSSHAVSAGSSVTHIAMSSVLTVRPRLESWVEVPTADFDAMTVVLDQPVNEGDVLATTGGTSYLAPHGGTVGSIEAAPDQQPPIRIRIFSLEVTP